MPGARPHSARPAGGPVEGEDAAAVLRQVPHLAGRSHVDARLRDRRLPPGPPVHVRRPEALTRTHVEREGAGGVRRAQVGDTPPHARGRLDPGEPVIALPGGRSGSCVEREQVVAAVADDDTIAGYGGRRDDGPLRVLFPEQLACRRVEGVDVAIVAAEVDAPGVYRRRARTLSPAANSQIRVP